MASTAIQYRAGDLTGDIEARTPHEGASSAVARTMAQRYADCCRRSLPILELDEWRLVVRACSGLADLEVTDATRWRTEAEDLLRLGQSEVEDPTVTLVRLSDLTYAECLAAWDLAERYWAAHSRDERMLLPGEGS